MKKLKVFLTDEAFGIVDSDYNYDRDKGYPIAIVANSFGNLNQWDGDEAHVARQYLDTQAWKVLDITAEDLFNALKRIHKEKSNGS